MPSSEELVMSGKRVMVAFHAIVAWVIMFVAVSMAQDAVLPTASPLARSLMTGTPQIILAVCLLATSGALVCCVKLLISAYRERINALEAAVSIRRNYMAEVAQKIDAMEKTIEACQRSHGIKQ